MTPQISVIIPVYNGEQWLEPTIRSVIGQENIDFELLIGDDFSSDGSQTIIKKFQHDPRIRSFFFEQNAGLFGNLNRLLSKARAPLVHFLCQDDILETNCLVETVSFFKSNPDVVMSYCSARYIDVKDNVISESHTSALLFETGMCLQLLLYFGCIPASLSPVSARVAAIDTAGRFDESYRFAGDYEMWVRLCQVGKVAHRAEKLVRLREHSGRLSYATEAGVQLVKETRKIRLDILQLLPTVIQSRARKYAYWRLNVLDTHHFVRCLLAGRLKQCAALITIIGIPDLIAGFALWLITLNNHLYQPQPILHSGKTESNTGP